MPSANTQYARLLPFRCSFMFDQNRIVHKILFYDILGKRDYKITRTRIISTVYKCHKITIIYVQRQKTERQNVSKNVQQVHRVPGASKLFKYLFLVFSLNQSFITLFTKTKKKNTKGLIKSISIFNKNHYMFYAKRAFSVRSLYLLLYAMLVQILYLFRFFPSPVPRQSATTAICEGKSTTASRCGTVAYFHIVMRPGSPFHYL